MTAEISLQGGEGIGTVTRKGSACRQAAGDKPHSAAHHRDRRARSDRSYPRRSGGVLPRKARFARKTYNARLGILGGISIIGTTGIVTPMSEESWKRSLSLELEIKRAAGLERVVLVPGNHGERFVREQMGIDPQMVVTMRRLRRLHD